MKLQDVVMARYIDDMSFSTIRELIALNNVDIIKEVPYPPLQTPDPKLQPSNPKP